MKTPMKAAAYTRCGPPDVIQIKDVPKPIAEDDEVLIKVRAAGLSPLDGEWQKAAAA